MKHFLRCNPEEGQAIELAIETVGRAGDDALTAQLVDFLMGDLDGNPKVIFKQWGDNALLLCFNLCSVVMTHCCIYFPKLMRLTY